jgi:DNA-binding LytR/AlgR family response regulator
MKFKGVFTKKALITILIRVLINTTLGSIIACFMYRVQTDSFLVLFLEAQIVTHSVSTFSFIAGRFLNPIRTSRFSLVRFLIVIAGILASATLGVFFGIGVVRFLLSEDLTATGAGTVGIVIPSLLITSIFIAFFTTLGRIREKQNDLEQNLRTFEKAQESGSDRYLSLKDDDFHRMIEYKNVIYLSSSGRISVVHTKDKDYEIHELLGDMEKILPKNIFLRIHKQFVVNIRFISGLRYYEGGRYNMHLSDEDETVLPVGKAFTKDVKLRMKI